MTIEQLLFFKIEDFYASLQRGELDHPLDLAKALEKLANQAWDNVDEIYPPSLLVGI